MSEEGLAFPATFTLPILRNAFPGQIEAGSSLLIEFAPDSIWYETSRTIAARALRDGLRVQYHTYERPSNEVRVALTMLGLDVAELEGRGVLCIIDSYTAQTGLRIQDEPKGVLEKTVKLSDWSIAMSQQTKTGYAEHEKGWLHVDDNFSAMNRHNTESAVVDWFKTRAVPESRASGTLWLVSVLTGVASDSFYRHLESLCDGVIDFRSQEKDGRIEQYLRMRLLRGKTVDSRWQKLRLLNSGEVVPAE